MTPTEHPRHGLRRPATGVPARRPGSVRRTTTHDSLRPDGIKGDILLVATGRDLRTGLDGEATVVDATRVELRIAYQERRRIDAITADPAHPALEALVGGSAAVGYRAAVEAALPGERERGTLLFQLLDDVPNAILVNGYAMARALPHEDRVEIRRRSTGKPPKPDLCSGWRTGGTIMRGLEATGALPLAQGPAAPNLDRADDPWAWHAVDRLPPTSMRRTRRIDVWRDGELFAVDAFFRDSYADGGGHEDVVHEYQVQAAADASTLRFQTIDARIGVLPFVDCNDAAASAARLVGAPVANLRETVRRGFTGPTTCTHLNDTLRALEDLPALINVL